MSVYKLTILHTLPFRFDVRSPRGRRTTYPGCPAPLPNGRDRPFGPIASQGAAKRKRVGVIDTRVQEEEVHGGHPRQAQGEIVPLCSCVGRFRALPPRGQLVTDDAQVQEAGPRTRYFPADLSAGCSSLRPAALLY